MKKTIIASAALLFAAMATAQITSQPDGDLLPLMEWQSQGMAPDYASGSVSAFTERGAIASVVRQGSKFYIKDPISHYRIGVWIEGELNEDGTQVVFHTPQAFTLSNGSMFYVTRLVRSGQSLAKDPAATDLVFSLADDGRLTQTDGGYLSVTNLDGRTAGYVDYNIVIAPVAEQPACPPADAEMLSYQMSFESEGAPTSKTIDVAFSGTDVYIANPSGTAGSWIHGTIEGNTIVCPNSQFVGPDDDLGYYAYLKAAEGSVEVITIPGFGEYPVTNIALTNAEAVVFAYNPADRSFHTDQLFLVNADKDKLADRYTDYDKAAFTTFNLQPAVPADPVIVSNSGILEDFGFGLFAIDLPAEDTDGNYIDQSLMYYNVYIDGALLQAPSGETDIPYSYTDGQFIRVSGISHSFTYYTPITTEIAVQVFYKVGDVVNHSNLVVFDVQADGIAAASTAATRRVDYFDAAGRPAAPTAKGLLLRRTTHADGTVTTAKVSNR